MLTYVLRLICALATVLVLPFQAAASSTDIPASHGDDLRQLWRSVMSVFYGPYDRSEKCWVGTFEIYGEDTTLCMRPHKLDIVEAEHGREFYFAIGGHALPHPMSSAAPGPLGLLVLRQDGDRLKVKAKHLVHEIGFYGETPRETFFEFEQIGPEKTFGWVVETGIYHNGQLYAYHSVFGPRGDDIALLGYIPSGFDETDVCTDGKSDFSGEGCTKYFGKISFSRQGAGQFFPMTIQFEGLLDGEKDRREYILNFDTSKQRYVLPDDFPFRWGQSQ